MSLKVTVEVDGQSEQQLAPVIGQMMARHSKGLDAPENNAEPTEMRDFYLDQSALLQQVQQLVAQNQRLQVQLTQSQRLLAGTPAAKAFLPSPEQSARSPATSGSAADSAAALEPTTTAPPLPAQYQTGHIILRLSRLQKLLVKLPAQLWRKLVWISFGQEWLLVFLLLCSGLSGTWAIALKITKQLKATPEFVESADDGPGESAPTKREESAAVENPAETAPPSSLAAPTNKAGSHPAPPPAFASPDQ